MEEFCGYSSGLHFVFVIKWKMQKSDRNTRKFHFLGLVVFFEVFLKKINHDTCWCQQLFNSEILEKKYFNSFPSFLWSKKCCPALSSEDSDLVIDFSFSHEVNHLNLGPDPVCFIAWFEQWTNEILCIWLPKVLKLQQTHPCRENCRTIPSLIKWIPNDFFCNCVTHLLCSGSWIYYNTVP